MQSCGMWVFLVPKVYLGVKTMWMFQKVCFLVSFQIFYCDSMTAMVEMGWDEVVEFMK